LNICGDSAMSRRLSDEPSTHMRAIVTTHGR
jgi:hypothetical protein